MIYPIHTYGSDFLRKKVADVDFNTVDLKPIIDDMFETMHNAKGAGLAANQIGIDMKIVIVENEIRPGELFKGVFINPNLLHYSGYSSIITEGCLSFPGLPIGIERPFFAEFEWQDEKGELHKKMFEGIESRILQHEIEHLYGILFIDRLRPEDKLKLFMRLEDIKNKKIKTSYLTQ